MNTVRSLVLAFCLALALLVVLGISMAHASAEPPIGVSIDLPGSAIYGHRPLTFTVSAVNHLEATQAFTIGIWHGGRAWGGEDRPYQTTPNSEVKIVHCSTYIEGCLHIWRGTLLPKATAAFTLPTFTGAVTGTYRFVDATVSWPEPLQDVERLITITVGSEPPSGKLSIVDGDLPWLPGQLRGVQLTLLAPKLTQFHGGKMQSTCGIEGLPAGFTSDINRTYAQFLWHPFLPVTAPGGPCVITEDVVASGEYFTTSIEFSIPYRIYVPVIMQ